MPYYTFQESKIWEGNNTVVDPNGDKVTVKASNETVARRKVNRKHKTSSIGRYWVLLDAETKE